MKATDKIEILRKAGVSVNNLFSLTNICGEEKLVRADNGVLTIVPDTDPLHSISEEYLSLHTFDPLCKSIREQGTVNNPHLFRRWVMAQVFHMLSTGNFSQALRSKGYRYEWKMMEEELRVQSIIYQKDTKSFIERNLFFNKLTAIEMCRWYLALLTKAEEKSKKSRREHGLYDTIVKLGGRHFHITDLAQKKNKIVDALNDIMKTGSPTSLYHAFHSFHSLIKSIWYPSDAKMSTAFVNAYKGVGGYSTMKNLILFHDCHINTGERFVNQTESLRILKSEAEENREEGWRMMAMLSKFIVDNGINIRQKIAEWRK